MENQKIVYENIEKDETFSLHSTLWIGQRRDLGGGYTLSSDC